VRNLTGGFVSVLAHGGFDVEKNETREKGR
jgi:hypothetical protein